MRILRFGVLVSCLGLFTFLRAEPLTIDIRVSGDKVGENVFEEKPDGSFDSETKLAIGTTSVDTGLTGHFVNGVLKDFVATQKATGVDISISWANDTLTVMSGGKVVRTAKQKIATTAFFATYHPQILRTLYAAYKKTPDAKEFSVFSLDQLAEIKMPVSPKSPRKVTSPSGQINAFPLGVKLVGIDIEYVFDESGKVLGMAVPVQQAEFLLQGYSGIFTDPLAKYPELSQPTHEVIAEKAVKQKMRDGVDLVSEITRPKEDGKYPVILVRTPYGRVAETIKGSFWARRGYVLVAQDCRGRGDSDGDWDPFVNERKDGADTIDWITKQPWSNGKVGMIGGSYLALVQWSAAVEHPAALKCIIPQVSPPDPMLNLPYENGAFMLAPDIWWSRVVMSKNADLAGAFTPVQNAKGFAAMPLSIVDDKVLGRDVPFYDKWLARPRLSDWKGAITMAEVAKVKIPVLHISGTWDGDGIGTLLHWEGLKANGNKQQWLILGPWEHGFNVKTKYLDQDYGPGSVLELDSVYLRWFDTWLKGRDVGLQKMPKASVFYTGANVWRTGSDWPLPASHPVTWYLGGSALLAKGTSKGTLSSTAKASKPDSYVYDPNKIGNMADEMKVQADEAATSILPMAKSDGELLAYRTAAFKKATDISGPMEVQLYVSTTARDATFHATLVDELPDGRMRIIGLPGTMRATYINGSEHVKPLTPGRIYKLTIQPWHLAHRFEKGHRAVLIVVSDQFPRFARNPGTGEPDLTAKKMIRAVHTIYHDPKHPSYVRVNMIGG